MKIEWEVILIDLKGELNDSEFQTGSYKLIFDNWIMQFIS